MISRQLIIQKAAATGTHIVISTLLVGTLIAISYLYWYPGVHARLEQISQLLIILAMVDIVIGPILTFVVFDRSKKYLVFDMLFIAIVQLVFLAIGTHTLWTERPIATAFSRDVFVNASPSTYEFHGKNFDYLEGFAGSSPKLVYVDQEKLNAAPNFSLELAGEARFMNEYSIALAEKIDAVEPHGLSKEQLIDRLPAHEKTILDIHERHKTEAPNARFFRLVGKNRTVYVLLDPDTLTFLDMLDVDVSLFDK